MKPGESQEWCVGVCPQSPLAAHLTLSLCDTETAGSHVLLLLLLLLAAVLTRTQADPVPRATRLPVEAKDCHIAQFKSLSPKELQAFKKAKDAIVSLPLPSCVG